MVLYEQPGRTLANRWVLSGGKWYYMKSDGSMATGWQKVSGKWYYFNQSGVMQTGWQKIGGKWYYMNSQGEMFANRWVLSGGKWYYMKSDGSMATGWQKVSGKCRPRIAFRGDGHRIPQTARAFPIRREKISYREKRLEVMHSPSHVVEVDLLRSGTGIEVQGLLPPHDYLVHESSVDDLPKGRIWAIPLECPLPKVEIPLRGTDPAAVSDLQQVVNAAYDLGDYDLDIDYHVEPVPPLSPDKAEWPDRLLKSKKLR